VRGLLAGLFVLVTLAGVAVASAVWLGERRVLFPARRAPDASGLLRRVSGEQIWLDGGGARTEAWLLPARGGARGAAPLIVYMHGNGELIDDWAAAFDVPRSWGASVLLVEYPGYGRSGGSPSEEGIAATVVSAYDWSSARPDVDPRRIIAFGRSLGGGAACELAEQRDVAALVLESTFTSVRALAVRMGVPGFLVRDRFDSLSRLARFRGPMLTIHGALDRTIPVEHARALHAAVPQSELVILGDCGHNDCPHPWPKLRQFLVSHDLLRE
jgi:fermentation-respiration switch protein FrsA (DUF1100 family)